MPEAARSYRAFPGYDDLEDDGAPRRPNVPGAPASAAPAYRPAPPRLMGETGQIARPVNVPRPIPGAGTPRPGRAPMPGRPALPLPTQPAVGRNHQPRPGLLERLNLAPGSTAKLVLTLAAIVIAIGLIFIAVSNLVSWWNTWQDDLTYGRPRTMQVEAWVGHNESTGRPTHFIAQNINGQVTILEYPGGDTSKTVVIQGPQLYQKNADLVPVKIRLEDVNADGHVDLVVTFNDQTLVYLNDSGKFRPSTPDEARKFKLDGK